MSEFIADSGERREFGTGAVRDMGVYVSMTNYERIMADMTVRQLAELMTIAVEEPEQYENYTVTYHYNNAGKFYDRDYAIEEQENWLLREAK